MLGAIIGDIIGSRFVFKNYKGKNFNLFDKACHFTDDSVMTLAVATALMDAKADYSDLEKQAISNMQKTARLYPSGMGYGRHFCMWLLSKDPKPYNSWGNGAAMRVSPCGFFAKSVDEVKILSKAVTEISHNHPEGIKGAECTAVCVYMAKNGKTIAEIKKYVCENYYNIDFTLDDIRPKYVFNPSCQGTVPQALEAFFESVSYEDTIRNVISIGGDSDTIGAIAGGIAEAFYGIPDEIVKSAESYLDDNFKDVLNSVYAIIGQEKPFKEYDHF